MGRGAWQATVHGVPKSWTRQSVWVCAHACVRMHTHTHTFIYLVAPRLSCGMWDLVSQLGMEFRSSASGALSLSHWTTRKSLLLLLDVTDTGEPGSMTGVLTAQEDGFSFVQSRVFQPWHCWLWGRTALCCGDWPVHWWVLGRIPAVLDVSQSQTRLMRLSSSSSPHSSHEFAKCPLRGEVQINPVVKNHWSKVKTFSSGIGLNPLAVSLGAENLLFHVASGSGSLVWASHPPSCLPGTCRVPGDLMRHTAVSWLGPEETSAARATF